MTFDVHKFINQVSKTNGMAKSSHYMAVITPPSKVDAVDLAVGAEDLAFRVESVEWPGRAVNNVTYRDIGPVRRIAFDSNYVEMTMSVLLSSDFREKVFFERWQDLAIGNSRTKDVGPNNPSSVAYATGYYSDYIGTITLYQYDEAGEITYTTDLLEAYPQLVSPVAASWSDTDFQKANITVAFHRWKDRVIEPGKTIDTKLRTGSWFRTSGAGGVVSTLGGVLTGNNLRQATLIGGAVTAASRASSIFNIR